MLSYSEFIYFNFLYFSIVEEKLKSFESKHMTSAKIPIKTFASMFQKVINRQGDEEEEVVPEDYTLKKKGFLSEFD